MSQLATRYQYRRGIMGLNGLATVDGGAAGLGQPEYHGRRSRLLRGLEGLGDEPPLTVDLPNGTTDYVVGTTPDGMLLTAGGWHSLPMPDNVERWINVHSGQIMLSDGSLVDSSTPTSSGSTVLTTLQTWLQAGGQLAQGVSNILQTLGITSAPGTGWVNGTQYRLANGQLVTPTKLPNGLYEIPGGTIVGAPPSSSLGWLALGAGVGLGVWWFTRRKRA